MRPYLNRLGMPRVDHPRLWGEACAKGRPQSQVLKSGIMSCRHKGTVIGPVVMGPIGEGF